MAVHKHTPPEGLPDYFEPIKHLGEGGMGVVWSVKDKRINKAGALKAIRPSSIVTTANLTRFEREIRNFALLTHPYIVQVYDVGKLTNDAPYIFMEEVRGQPLNSKLFENLSLEQILEFFDRVLEALAWAHSNGIIHRDLKPDNVLVTRDLSGAFIPKIMDFGLALRADEQDTRITVDGMVVGTPIYMAPEQACDEHFKISPSTDLYALGCIIYEFFSGKPPFDGKNAVTVLLAQAGEQPPPFVPKEQFSSSIRMGNIIMRLLEKMADKRFESAADLRAALRRTLLIRDGLRLGLEALSASKDTIIDETQPEERAFFAPVTSVKFQNILPELIDANYQYSVLSLRAPAFVGRATSTQVLWQYLKEVHLTKRTALCIVTGRPGVGKSHFVSHFAQNAYTMGCANKLTVDTSKRHDVLLAFYNAVFAKLLLRTLNSMQVPAAIAYFLNTTQSDPRAQQLLDIFEHIDVDPQSIPQELLLFLFHDIVARLCNTKPLILCFDNVQRDQTQSLKAVIQLLSASPSCKLPILMLVTNATINDVPTDIELSLGNNPTIWLRRGICLEPLSDTDMHTLIEVSLSIRPNLTPYIAKIAGGYPKIAVSIARQWQLAGLLKPGPQGYLCECCAQEFPIPKDVLDAILSLLYLAFSAYDIESWLPIAALAATLGDSFSPQLLSHGVALLPSAVSMLSAATFIDEALTGAVIRANTTELLSFTNPLMREALLTNINAAQWCDLNIAAAGAKKSLPPTNELNKEIAQHLLDGRKFDEAYEGLFAIAKQNLHQGLWEQSLAFIQKARHALTQHLGVLDAKNPKLSELWALEAEIYIQKSNWPEAQKRIDWLSYALQYIKAPLWPVRLCLLQARLQFAQELMAEARENTLRAEELLLQAAQPNDTAHKELVLHISILKFHLLLINSKQLLSAAKAFNDPLYVSKILLIVAQAASHNAPLDQSITLLNLVYEMAQKSGALSAQAQALHQLARLHTSPDIIKKSLIAALRCYETLSDYPNIKAIHLQIAQVLRQENKEQEAKAHERWAELI